MSLTYTVYLWYASEAEAAARFYAETFPDSSVSAVHRAPSDNASSKAGDMLTVECTVMGIPCIGLNGGPGVDHNWAFSFQVATEDQAETDRYWNAIVGNGGTESQCGVGTRERQRDPTMFYRSLTSLLLMLWLISPAAAQEKSVKPGINDTFRNPDPQEFVERFEIESREVFQHRQKILEACQIQPGQTVADIGAGTGLFTRLFSEAVGEKGRVIAVDIAKEFLAHIAATSRKLGQKNVETLLCTADSTELPENSIDVAFICDTYHHFEFPLKTMASLHRALKPGGRLLVIDFHRIPGKSREWTLNHVRAGQEVFESEIVKSGFLKTREETGLLEENYFVEFTKSSTPGLQPPQYPVIAGYGGVVPVAGAAERPRAGAKLLLDVTAATPPEQVNKGLDRAARLLNLYGVAGLKATDVKVAVVLHGEATKSVLNDEFYQPRFGVQQNPNLELIKKLQQAGVEVLVCGQALNYQGFPESAVESTIPIADSALSVIANRQMDGYGYLPIP